jgi:hypothetical protein
MPYKIHVENTVPDDATGIILETAPLFEVETKEQAKEVLARMHNQGLRGLYALGFDA